MANHTGRGRSYLDCKLQYGNQTEGHHQVQIHKQLEILDIGKWHYHRVKQHRKLEAMLTYVQNGKLTDAPSTAVGIPKASRMTERS